MVKCERKKLLPFVSAVFAFVLFILVLLCAKSAYAGTVYPSEKKYSSADKINIQNELNRSGKVTLVKNRNYYLNGPIYISSNQTINAAGATITCNKSIMSNIPSKTKYNSIKNFTLNGGYWRFADSNGYSGSSIKITHGQNIKIENVKLRHANAGGHSIELVACKNVKITGCNIAPLGSSNSKTEEAIQLDVATHTTAYFLESQPFKTNLAKKLQNGATCQDVRIENNTIVGNRGVVANYTNKEGKKYLNRLHSNITIKNNKITGLKGEGVSLFNTSSAAVTKNTIISKASGSSSAYTIGLHVANFGRNSQLMKGKITVTNNKIKGGRQTLQIYSHSSSKFGTVTVKNNKLYCKKGKGSAIKILSKQCKSLSKKNNKTYSWNGK